LQTISRRRSNRFNSTEAIVRIFNKMWTLCTFSRRSPLVFHDFVDSFGKNTGVGFGTSFLSIFHVIAGFFDGVCFMRGVIPLRRRVVPPFQLHMRYAAPLSPTSRRTVHLK
jgi:hypothetical protein